MPPFLDRHLAYASTGDPPAVLITTHASQSVAELLTTPGIMWMGSPIRNIFLKALCFRQMPACFFSVMACMN